MCIYMYVYTRNKSQVSQRGGHSMEVFGSKRVVRARSGRSERSEPRERNESCSERSDEARDCKEHMTQTKART